MSDLKKSEQCIDKMRNSVDLLCILEQNKVNYHGTSSRVGAFLNRVSRAASSPIVHWIIIFLCILHMTIFLVIFMNKTQNSALYSFCQEIYFPISIIISVYCIYDSLVILVYICKLLRVKYGVSGKLKDETIIMRNSVELFLNLVIGMLSITGLSTDIIGFGKILGYAANWKRLSVFLRKQVGQNKRFYTNEEYCLDLVYITDRVIAMGLPAINIEAIYRNPIEEVSTFFMTKYPRNHMIINLCNEREHYSLSYFHSIVSCPFPDHQVPTLGSLFIICFLVLNYLVSNRKNVVAIHCKGGKGRTGIVVVAWLLYSRLCSSLEEALEYYSNRRTDLSLPGCVKTIKNPSQIRFVHYFDFLLKHSFPESVIKRGSNFFWEDLQRGFRSGYYWNICNSELRRVNQKCEKRHWKISELLRDQCIYLPQCLTNPINVFPVSIIVNNKEREISNIFEWKICLHSEYNRDAEYLYNGLTTNFDWNPRHTGTHLSPSLYSKGEGYQFFLLESDSNKQALSYFGQDQSQLIYSARSKVEQLVSSLKNKPFSPDIVTRTAQERPKPWIEREFVIKIFGYESPQRHLQKHSLSPKSTHQRSEVDSETTELSCLLYDPIESFKPTEEEEENAHMLRSISLIDFSNPERKKEFSNHVITAVNTPYKDIVEFPIKKINEWGSSRRSFSNSSVALAHFWLHPALIHTSGHSNLWTFFLEWDTSSKAWLVRDCFLSISLQCKKEIDIRSSNFENVCIDVTFQYK
ncbi:Dual specificity phosphatase catalytic domain protein [Cryptosporidium meleagridis]|uniref:Dual specificity phosphatase catalytic domain protein n=1 Tax=Cryptosporidium meleagridis TaxID=93969 RepID=A0A2P4Z2X1_9CRYT|nr:Dual specificity phosphatase catalytic domain protein [Cryptosporidium meleagridis]